MTSPNPNMLATGNSIPKWQVDLIGIIYIILAIILGILVYKLWPQYDAVTGDYDPISNFFWTKLSLSLEHRTIILVLITGAIGSFLHGASSFTNFVGENKLEKSWIWWYMLRPFIGMAVAIVFYLVIRGGLLTDTQADSLNIYGVLAVSALSGLSSDRATLKLKEIFESMFQTKDKRTGKLNNNQESDK